MVVSFVGCGFSANSILYHLNKLLSRIVTIPLVINIFERRDSFGDGISYNISNEFVLLNRPSKYMSIDHNYLSHFSEYLHLDGSVVNKYATRKSFGLYLTSTLQSTIASAISQEKCNLTLHKKGHC